MFLVNSRFTRFRDAPRVRVKVTRLTHHIPKLRSNFAEFLRYRYPNVLACDASPSVVIFSTVAEVNFSRPMRPPPESPPLGSYLKTSRAFAKRVAFLQTHRLQLALSSKGP